MEKCCVLKMVDDFLHDRIPGIWNRADLVSLWKDLPSEPPTDPFDSDELELPSRSELLDGCISQAEEERSAREELRSLLGYLLDEGEDIPEPLSSWVHREYVGRNPPAKRGRPRLVNRDVGIVVAYIFLIIIDFSHEAAIEFIACRIERDTETVRPIVRILRTKLGMDWRGMRDLLLQQKP